MAIKTSQRLFCVDDNLVILEGDEIIHTLEVDKEVFQAEVIRQIKKKQEEGKYIRSIMLFKNVVEEIYGIPLKHFGYKLDQKCLHDSSFYKDYLEFLSETMNFKKKEPLSEKAKKNKEKERLLKCYYNELFEKEAHKKYKKYRRMSIK